MVRSTVLAAVLALTSAPVPSVHGADLCVPGAAVAVLYGGDYYAATVLEGPASDGTCLVSYDGYPSTWDEWVSPPRLRSASGSDLRGTSQEVPATVPEGIYNCYRLGANGPDYIYADLEIEPGSRYRFVDRQGRFKYHADGEIVFGGEMSEAEASLEMMATGVAQIKLKVDLWGDEPLRCTLAK